MNENKQKEAGIGTFNFFHWLDSKHETWSESNVYKLSGTYG